MPEWLEILVLGVIEGVTEFLPISSTGHLILAQAWMRPRSDLFNFVIQSGAVLAVILVFFQRVRHLVVHWRREPQRTYLLKLGLAFLVASAGGLGAKALGFDLPDAARPVALATLIGGILILVIERHVAGKPLQDEITWAASVAVGLAQIAALVFPGTSRSGATILVALLLGTSRRSATEFSFLLGVPSLLAAGAFELLSAALRPGPQSEPWEWVILGTATAAVTAFLTVRWLLQFVQTHTFRGFGYYRIALGLLILVLLALQSPKS